ncbi:epoxide hydrolase [Sistotremastrum suecicum HHB10207 ss-3]|uniref:Epoxide hydrolase n=1 Tax=Sistotremastrum suecicum HHB10207 ss-3 TaxID=1314776 RepID=A0A166HQK4_9AGAM|nr:epoxide hydrolase [Sistotremastrum suecicum HHB10207 ss-3]
MKRNPLDPTSFNHRKEKLSTGRTYHFIDECNGTPSSSTLTLLCLHGFPDLWYGWRHQIGPWCDQGWRVVVPDMLGYGETDSPLEIEAFSTKNTCRDLAALLDLLNVQKAVVIGHDWGSATAWRFGLWHPDRILAMVNLAIPFYPPLPVLVSVNEMARRYPTLGYQTYFEQHQSTEEIESKVSHDMRRFFKVGELRKRILEGGPKSEVPELWNKQDEAYYMKNFRASGMRGPLNYYRTTELRFEEEKGKPLVLPAHLPWMLIWGTLDDTCTTKHVANTKKWVPQLEDVRVENAGHWLMVENSEFVTGKIAGFIRAKVVASVAAGQSKL